MDKTQKEKIRERFGEYLRDNWDDRENLPVADWWLNELDLAIKETEGRIVREIAEKMREQLYITSSEKESFLRRNLST